MQKQNPLQPDPDTINAASTSTEVEDNVSLTAQVTYIFQKKKTLFLGFRQRDPLISFTHHIIPLSHCHIVTLSHYHTYVCVVDLQDLLRRLPGITDSNVGNVMSQVEDIAELSSMGVDALANLLGNSMSAKALHSFFRRDSNDDLSDTAPSWNH